MRRRVVRLGLVGCGRLAEQGYAPAVGAVDDAEIVAVADPDADRRARLAELVAGPGERVVGHSGVTGLVEAGGVDAVVIASPVEHHVDDAAVCAAAGIPTLVEKPPASTLAGAHELAALDPCPWVGFNRRFDSGVRRVRAAVPHAGRVHLSLEIAYRRASWQALTVRDDALLDLGPHVVDLAVWLTGSAVRAVHGADLARERARVDLVLDRGDARVALASDRPYRERIEVRDGTDAVLARHTLGGPAAAVRDRVRRGPHPLVATLTAELHALVRAVRGEGRGALADARDAAGVMAVLDAIRASAADAGRLVPVAAEGVRCS